METQLVPPLRRRIVRFHNLARVSQCIATHLNVSVCFYYLNSYFADDLTQELPQLCFICYWKHPLKPLSSADGPVLLRWRHWTRLIMVLNYQEDGLLGNVVRWILRPQCWSCHFPETEFLSSIVCRAPPHCEHVGGRGLPVPSIRYPRVWSDNKQGYTSLYIIPFIQFLNFNACVNTGVLSHPMNVCKYAEVYVTASRKKQRLFSYYILKQISGCEDF